MTLDLSGIVIVEQNALTNKLLTPDCLSLIVKLHRALNPIRKELLKERQRRLQGIAAGTVLLEFPKETKLIRDDPKWRVTPPPKDLEKRWIEITGPPSAKMSINAMNSGADVFMADFEDALAPTWNN